MVGINIVLVDTNIADISLLGKRLIIITKIIEIKGKILNKKEPTGNINPIFLFLQFLHMYICKNINTAKTKTKLIILNIKFTSIY